MALKVSSKLRNMRGMEKINIAFSITLHIGSTRKFYIKRNQRRKMMHDEVKGKIQFASFVNHKL